MKFPKLSFGKDKKSPGNKSDHVAGDLASTIDLTNVSEDLFKKYQITISRFILSGLRNGLTVGRVMPIPLPKWLPLDKDGKKIEEAVGFSMIEKYFKEEFVDDRTSQPKYEIVEYAYIDMENNGKFIPCMKIRRLM